MSEVRKSMQDQPNSDSAIKATNLGENNTIKRPGSARSSITGTIGRGGPLPQRKPFPPSSGKAPSVEDASKTFNIKNLWTIIQEQKKNQEKPKTDVMECNVLLLGAESSGKSCITYRTLKKDYIREKPPSTSALEYTYGKREESFKTLIAHFWEVAGGRKLVKLIDDTIMPDNIHMFTVIIVVNLSEPWSALEEIQFYLNKVTECVKNVCSKVNSTDLMGRLIARCKRKFGEKHPDINSIQFSGIPTIIVATHADEFEKKSPQMLKTVANTLRFLAHKNGCSLIYAGIYQVKNNEEFDRNFRAVMNYVMFSIQGGIKIEIDPMKPLRIVAGKDSFKSIGDNNFESYQKMFAFSEQDNLQKKQQQDSVKAIEEYQEPSIDMLRAQKDEELMRYRQKKEQEEKRLEKKKPL